MLRRRQQKLSEWRRAAAVLVLLSCALSKSSSSSSSVAALSAPSTYATRATTGAPKFAILGGTGKIGSAVATHLLQRSPDCDIILVGRRPSSGEAAMEEIRQALPATTGATTPIQSSLPNLSFYAVENIWADSTEEQQQLSQWFQDEAITCVIHTAGPYADESPTVLDAAIAAQVPVYVDVSDPLPFLEASLERQEAAIASGTTALCAAGAFPGMSNVLAMEAAGADDEGDSSSEANSSIQDVRFHYFTKGLGGSGTVNLYITNLGFGDDMTQHDNGERRSFQELSGQLLGTVDFFLPGSLLATSTQQGDNDQARERVGTQQVFAWPFPEAATVPSLLNAKGSSSAAMGTAPDAWNVMLGLLVALVPRPWWRSKPFSKFMADFSQPLVLLTDAFLKQTSPDQVGETHAMRVDVTTTTAPINGNVEGGGNSQTTMTSIVQGHESFRQCVGQSCAEFALDLLEHPASAGVYLPEQRYHKASDRQRILGKLTSTPGTFCYTGPVYQTTSSLGSNSNDGVDGNEDDSALPVYPTKIRQVVELAKQAERSN